ncbi:MULTISPECIES: S9 family peptidase [unclassified Bradyrhizobium]|uniref:alpha/beta hydrolase family protein n=1 Tax=unclassified Bradyrhizobium TaxID=2631580 RepID=UPI00143CEFCC|nr:MULTISPECIES: alpha/beta hydrolase [unclassified Bradyrhizobium]
MDQTSAKAVIDKGIDRFLADGVHYRDLINIREKVGDWNDWPVVWSSFAAEAEKRGEASLAQNAKLTAASEFARSAIYYHYAQYLLYDDIALKKRIHDKKTAVFLRAAPLFESPVERVEVPFDGIKLAGYFRRPAGVSNPPVVICIGGLDTTKEDYLDFSDECIRRGLATFAFDGPGQGETLFEMRLRPDYEKSVSAVIDYLESRIEIDSSRIGIVGRSMGGYYAPKAAAVDKRIKALACWGVLYRLYGLPEKQGNSRKALLYISGSETMEEAVEFYKFLDLKGYADKITCPTFVTHGGLDMQTPIINAEELIAEVKGPVETLIWDDAIHCCHDRSHIMRPAMADFLVRNL